MKIPVTAPVPSGSLIAALSRRIPPSLSSPFLVHPDRYSLSLIVSNSGCDGTRLDSGGPRAPL